MKQNIAYIFVSLCALLMASCVKDEPYQNFMNLHAEGFNPDASAKAMVEDEMTYWINGEQVIVNGRPYDIYADSRSDEARIIGIQTNNDHVYRAVYPASVLKRTSRDYFTIEIPKEHYFRMFNKKQVIEELPMVAYYSGQEDPETLEFKHLTAAITVQVKNVRNDRDDILELDCIELINTDYRLSGEVTVDIKDAAPDGSLQVEDQLKGEPDTVVMNFYHDKENKALVEPGSTIDVQMPILPVGEEKSRFTIIVKGHIKGARYTFEKTTVLRNNSILRACLGYATTRFETDSEAKDLFDVQTEQTITVEGEPITKNFYEINTPAELLTLAEALDSGWSNTSPTNPTTYRTGNYILTNDLDMGGSKIVPIHYYNAGGNERVYFYGNGKTISNFVASSINENEPNCCGLFGRTAGDSITITGLNIDNATFEFMHENQKIKNYDSNPCSAVGGIYACVDHAGIVIENCKVKNIKMGSVSTTLSGEKQTDFYAGGIVGVVFTSCTIRNCEVGSVTVDNTYDAASGALVDQFGAAVARIDVGDGNSKNTYGKMISAGRKVKDVPAVVIENFTYKQATDTPLVFSAGLKNIRCGGLVGNITRGGRLIMNNCKVTLNVLVTAKPSEKMYISGLIGCLRLDNTMGVYLNSNCEIHGTIKNSAISSYSNNFRIGKYYAGENGKMQLVRLEGSATTCTNDLTVGGFTSDFFNPTQTF